jgi:hypothetical protein
VASPRRDQTPATETGQRGARVEHGRAHRAANDNIAAAIRSLVRLAPLAIAFLAFLWVLWRALLH